MSHFARHVVRTYFQWSFFKFPKARFIHLQVTLFER
jgi:hypothetical protein